MVLPTFDVRAFLHTVVEERIDLLTSVPAIYALAIAQPDFAAFDVSRVTRIAYGGAPIAPSLVRRIQEHFPNARVGNGFGLTETSSIATFLPHEWAADHADSVGFAAPVVDLALDAVDAVSGVGELLIRGPNVVGGYWNKPDATRATFVDGWLHSGDLARIDDQGLVHVVDRAKDMINRGGENVYSVEVENALAGAPGVADAAVVAVPDDVMGEKVGAVVVPVPGSAFDVAAVLGSPVRAAGRFQGAAVLRGAHRSPAPQPRREDPQAAAPGDHRVGSTGARPLTGPLTHPAPQPTETAAPLRTAGVRSALAPPDSPRRRRARPAPVAIAARGPAAGPGARPG